MSPSVENAVFGSLTSLVASTRAGCCAVRPGHMRSIGVYEHVRLGQEPGEQALDAGLHGARPGRVGPLRTPRETARSGRDHAPELELEEHMVESLFADRWAARSMVGDGSTGRFF